MFRDNTYLLDMLDSAKIVLDYAIGINPGMSSMKISNAKMQLFVVSKSLARPRGGFLLKRAKNIQKSNGEK